MTRATRMTRGPRRPGADQVPPRWRAEIGRHIGIGIFHTAYRGRALHADKVPASGPVIVVANHTSFLDGPAVFAVLPRPSHFIVKQDYFHGPLGWLLDGVGQIPIDRSTGDRAALGKAVGVLKAGGVVGLFPEGTRGRGDVQAIHQGAAWLALQSGASIVPAASLGTRGRRGVGSLPRLGTTLTIVFGDAFGVDEVTTGPDGAPLSGRERLRAASELIRSRLAEHVAGASARTGIALPDIPL